MAPSNNPKTPHIALLPSSGMGHLTPFLRLAATLLHNNCSITFITIQPTITSAESNTLSRFFTSLPQINPLKFQIHPFDPTTATSTDPFYLHYEAIRRSAHLLPPLLLSLPPLSALITDISLTSAFIPIIATLRIPTQILFTCSAAMLAFYLHFPTQFTKNGNEFPEFFDIPGLLPIPKSSIPPLLHDPTNLFTTQFVENGQALIKADGILINTFDYLELEVLDALNGGEVVPSLPPVLTIGPLKPCEFERGTPLSWLDEQPEGSVVYVSFGSKTALSGEQIKELGIGLEKSGFRFLWVLKSKMVDREEKTKDLEKMLSDGFFERNKENGLVVMDWVEQGEILGHKAVGGFVSHCGWNSITEAIWNGIPVLGWPQGGDQRINAGVLERNGMGIWVKEWGWRGEGGVVKGEEIGEKVRELMEDVGLKRGANKVKEGARMAVGEGGSSDKGLKGIVEMFLEDINGN
ncbi:UDP-glycosyltransferase 708G1-like [Tasmannia lanceolata]|uniref:UDP-glycosyltransferase 708G1-like n=1 Tax=Tasmannia lanceolata TaxID=3420 RepID=UPI004064467E